MMKKSRYTLLPVLLILVVVFGFNCEGFQGWLSLALKNEANPVMDAKCDMKNGFIGCYSVKGQSLGFSIRYPEADVDVCGWGMNDMADIERLHNIDGLNLIDRSRRYALIYNAMVLSSAGTPPEYYDGLDWIDVAKGYIFSYLRKAFELECQI